MAQRRMNLQAPIEALFARRWSTRAFDPEKPVDLEQLAACLEAARWAPSCYGEQPWRFVVADRFEDEFSWRQILNSLVENNQLWAKNAPVLIVAAAEPFFTGNENPNRWAEYDTGQAVMSLCLQATALGLMTHQMAGFDAGRLQTGLQIPEHLHIMSVTALGHHGAIDNLEKVFHSRELTARNRKASSEFVYNGKWQNAWEVPSGFGWEARYQETASAQLPWYLPTLDPDIEQTLHSLSLPSAHLLDLGCGVGTQAVALAKRGFVVSACDISASAIAEAGKFAEREDVQIDFRVEDILHSQLSGTFDLIVDRGVFHCFSDEADRSAYLSMVARLLKPGGILLLKCFHKDETQQEGPPGRYDEADIVRFFSDRFELVRSKTSSFSSPASTFSPKALFCILRRR